MSNLVPVLSQNNNTENSTNLSLVWDDLTHSEHEIVVGVVFAGNPEEARKRLGMTHSTFYRKWGKIKGYYNNLLREFPKKAGEILVSQSIGAAQELGRGLKSDNEKIRQQAATEILDRTLSKEPLETGIKRKITLEEFINIPVTT